MKYKAIIFIITFCLVITPTSWVFATDELVEDNEVVTEEIQKEEAPKEDKIEVAVEQTESKEESKTTEVVEVKQEEKTVVEETSAVDQKQSKEAPMQQTNTKAPTAAASSDKLTVKINNALHINPTVSESSYEGKAIAYDPEVTISKNGTSPEKKFTNKWKIGPADTESFGYRYHFENQYVLIEDEEDIDKLVFDIPETNEAVQKITYKGDNKAIVTFKDGTTKELSNSNIINIAPVYTATPVWYLNYNYIDNISTGSGSWSNKDGVLQYSHTFSNPEIKSPNLTKDIYQFKYWQNEETGKTYVDGDVFSYKGPELATGSTKTVNVYAYWQPAVVVNLYNESELVQTLTSFESISSADFNTIEDSSTRKFLGWFENDNKAQDFYNAPAITKEAGYSVINLIARFEDIISEPEPEPNIEPETPIIPDTPTTTEDIVKSTDNKPINPTHITSSVSVATTTAVPASQPQTKSAVVENNDIPLVEPLNEWALVNLIATILSAIIALALLLIKKQKQDGKNEFTDKDKKHIRTMKRFKVFSLTFAVISAIVFLFTEDMRLPMTLVDRWTFIMILFLVIEIINIFIIQTHAKQNNEEEQ